jgi:hypothetical protein
LLGFEIARYVFGPDAEFLRSARTDDAIRLGMDIVQGARTPRDAIARAQERARAMPASGAADSTTR